MVKKITQPNNTDFRHDHRLKKNGLPDLYG